MRFLRALLNSGVFMIILLAAATLYLVYSDAIKKEHGIDVASAPSTPVESPAVQETVIVKETPVAPVPQASVTEPAPVAAQEPIQAEPAFETQPPAQAQSDMAPMMPYQAMMPMPQQMPDMQPMMPPMGAMPMPEMPPMMAYQPPMQQPEPMPMPQAYQQAMPQQMPNMQPMMQQAPAMQSNVERARAALYDGNLDLAKQAYQTELANNNDPDLHGELGNVYFAQQNWPDAAAEYAAAVDGLTAQNRFLQAQYVLGFLMQINPEMGQRAMTNLRAQMYPQK